jgi:hypothetical protein
LEGILQLGKRRDPEFGRHRTAKGNQVYHISIVSSAILEAITGAKTVRAEMRRRSRTYDEVKVGTCLGAIMSSVAGAAITEADKASEAITVAKKLFILVAVRGW